MDFPRIDSALEACRIHLKVLNETDEALAVEVETHIVSALVVLIVSEYEVFIEDAFGKRSDQCGDTHVANYVHSQLAKRFRSPDLSKVNDVLKSFGQDYRKSFFTDVENTPEHAAWDNIMRARHAIVHRQGSMNLTFLELTKSYDQTKIVIDKLVRTLGCETDAISSNFVSGA